MSTSESAEAAFMAKVTASTTHEIRNVLAIVKESAGLVEDMIRAFERSGSLKQDKVLRALGRIEAQVSRGAALMSSLNRFAHSLDPTENGIDLNEQVEQFVFLYQRFARQKNHVVQASTGDQALTVGIHALWLQMLLFAAMDCCSEQLPEGGTVTIRTSQQGGQPTLEFVGAVEDEAVPLAPTEGAGRSRLAELLNRFGASLEVGEPAGGLRISLSGDAKPDVGVS
ncbi:MAG: hypothetical protein GTO22_26185 [Gemmatimonadales bacterium]|nr:hypothetical protein [Gemmatimonadales bacterium]